MKAGLIYNPVSGRGQQASHLEAIHTIARRWSIHLTFHPTRGPGDASVLAETLAQEKDCLWVLGGDGTIREVGEGLLHNETPLWILPAGTSNVLARSLGIPLDPIRALEKLICGKDVWMDGGMANETPFFFMCGAGMDAEVMQAQNVHKKQRWGRMSFYPVVLKTFLTYPFPPLQLEAEGKVFRAPYIAVTNVPYIAGSYYFCPPAQPFDGKLHAVMVSFPFRWFLPFYALGLLLRPPYIPKSWTTIPITRARLSAEDSLPFQVDGDTVGILPVEITVVPKAIRVRLPGE